MIIRQHKRVVLVLWALAGNALAADLTMVAVDPFGRQIQGCHVREFRTVARTRGTDAGYEGRFQGLIGTHVPLGEYEARLACGGAEVRRRVVVDRSNEFEVVVIDGRQFISDHVPPKLVVKMESSFPKNETWWIRLLGVYNGRIYTDRFSPDGRQAVIVDPDPGSYFVAVFATTGYVCVREVDFVEFTSAWTFRSAGCSFGLDRFAHIVEDEDKRWQKKGLWYQEMREDQQKLRHAIDDAVSNK